MLNIVFHNCKANESALVVSVDGHAATQEELDQICSTLNKKQPVDKLVVQIYSWKMRSKPVEGDKLGLLNGTWEPWRSDKEYESEGVYIGNDRALLSITGG